MENTREWFNRNRERLFAEIGVYECMNCESTDSLHIHHVVPLANGGTNRITNLRVLCKECHAKAHGDSRLVRGVRESDFDEVLTLENLTEWRKVDRMSQLEIAEMVGCSTFIVSKRIERFRIDRRGVRRVKTSADKLIGYFAEMEPGHEVKGKEIYGFLNMSDRTFRDLLKDERVLEAMKRYNVVKQGHSYVKGS